MVPMDRYHEGAKWYDVFSAEPVYRPGRLAAIAALRLNSHSRVLDVGCGTGLNFAPLMQQMSPDGVAGGVTGEVTGGLKGNLVGLDQSTAMVSIAAKKAATLSPGSVRLVVGDAQRADSAPLREELLNGGGPFDAAIFTYSLSLMPQWRSAWSNVLALVRAGGRVAVVDLQLPHGLARPLSPLARAACWAGGSDIDAHPWLAVESETDEVWAGGLRAGHIQVRVGTVR
jgi:S-adenosylmethionine-diacylgycerolhomoserine-N-methlytransferase